MILLPVIFLGSDSWLKTEGKIFSYRGTSADSLKVGQLVLKTLTTSSHCGLVQVSYETQTGSVASSAMHFLTWKYLQLFATIAKIQLDVNSMM